jgi:hypothetical protein
VIKVTIATWSEANNDVCTAAIDALDGAAMELFGYSITSINDSEGGRERALRCFDLALERAGG